jgi:hypothetical protein
MVMVNKMKQISNTQIEIWLKANNIIYEKSELFHDYLYSLFKLIESTYMGDEFTPEEKDKKLHFDWCWNHVITNFEKENILFEKTGVHYEYFWLFFQDAFYYAEDKNELMKIEKFFKETFDLKRKKTKNELDMLADLYKILECSLKKLL